MPNEVNTATLISLLKADEVGILTAWVDQQLAGASFRSNRISRKEVAEESQRFLGLFRDAIGQSVDVQSPAWSASRQALEELSAARAQQGFTSSETATFVFSLKQILFDRLRAELAARPVELADATWTTSTLLDKLGLYTTDMYLRTREQVIVRQQQEMLELSTPVVTLWDGVLALPLIGTLDSARTQVVMESLLQRIVDSGALIAIIDITGVPTVDTLTAQHLLEDDRRGAADGRRLHHQRHPAADRTDDRAPRGGTGERRDQGHAGRCLRRGAAPSRPHRRKNRDRAAADLGAAGSRRRLRARGLSVERIPILKMGQYLLVTIQVDMHDRLAMSLQDDLTGKIVDARAPRACSSTSPPSKWSIRSSAGCSPTSPRCRASSTRRRWWWACARQWRSRSSSSVCRSRASRPRSTSSAAWSCCGAGSKGGGPTMPVLLSEQKPIETSEDVVAIRQAVRHRAIELGFNLVDQTKIVTAASELARNTLQYGGGGTLVLEGVQDGGRKGLRLTFEDHGPGIADVQLAMKDGYTTGNGLGLGLSGARRLSNEFTIDSRPGEGTRVTIVRWR